MSSPVVTVMPASSDGDGRLSSPALSFDMHVRYPVEPREEDQFHSPRKFMLAGISTQRTIVRSR